MRTPNLQSSMVDCADDIATMLQSVVKDSTLDHCAAYNLNAAITAIEYLRELILYADIE